MPRAIALKSFNRAYRHFCPLTFNTVFEAERLLLRPPLTFNKVFERTHQGPGPTAPIAGRSDNKIPKPSGDVTRLKRGGYTLSDQLSLPKSVYQEIRSAARNIALKVFEPSKRFNNQDPSAKQEAVQLLEEAYPLLMRYENHWPANDFFEICQNNIASRYHSSGKHLEANGTFTLGGRVRLQTGTGERKGKGKGKARAISVEAEDDDTD